jgi:hypothetical protein
VLHAAVEDDADVGAALVLPDELDDRLPAHLLLAVGDEAEVDRQRPLGRELPRGVDRHPELPLVVRDPARVQPLVPDRRLEGIGLPELERRRRLHVVVPVDEDGRRAASAGRRADLADDERPLAPWHELGLAAAATDLVGHPLRCRLDVRLVRRVGAHGPDAEESPELVEPLSLQRRHRARV